ncbi:glycosyl hydrolase [Trichoderma arundinaceum]|uniref:Glycosyl hydrolase n=1 Tax=Trichoderma arundinaceum TaxID=490622 RepID=A0A395NPC4_TRIAR|nr:glycosyl hydrolase [Trichoderma arundinaceum]
MSLRDATTDAAEWLGRCEAAIGLDATLRPGSPGPESSAPLAPNQQIAAAGAGTGGEVPAAAGYLSEKNRGSPAEPPSYRRHGSKFGPLSPNPPPYTNAQLRPDPPRSFSLASLIHKVCMVFVFLSAVLLVSGLFTTYGPDSHAAVPDVLVSSSSPSSSSSLSYTTQLPATQLEQLAFNSYGNTLYIMALPSWLWRHALAYSAVLSSILTPTHAAPSTSLSATDYVANSVTAIRELNNAWYDTETGLWNSAWWNSGNAFTILADFAQLRLNEANQLNVGGFLRNTYTQAQLTSVSVAKFVNAVGLPTSTHYINGKGYSANVAVTGSVQKRGFADFLDDFYDDEGWWALGLIHAHDATGDQDYLDSAIEIFNDMQTGTGTPCGGGIYWSKDRTYVNAIANELYLSVAAALANRVPSNGTYLRIAKSQWQWFRNSGMINSNNLINDGLDSNCKNNGLTTWSYNQGVILGGLSELAIATGDGSYLTTAAAIANAAINNLSNSNGILVEADQCELEPGNCGLDGQQFKGVFIRNLRYLNDLAPNNNFKNFILRNAQSIWNNDRNSNNMLGVAWTGPYVSATGPAHSSALDALVAAIAVSS